MLCLCESGFSVWMAGIGVLCLADTCTPEVHPVFNPVAPYGYLIPDKSRLSCLKLSDLVSTSPAFVSSSANRPAGPHGRHAQKTVNRERLPRLTRRTLAQLRTNKSPFLKSYLHKIDAKSHPYPLCILCNTHTHDTHHLFSCTYAPHCHPWICGQTLLE